MRGQPCHLAHGDFPALAATESASVAMPVVGGRICGSFRHWRTQGRPWLMRSCEDHVDVQGLCTTAPTPHWMWHFGDLAPFLTCGSTRSGKPALLLTQAAEWSWSCLQRCGCASSKAVRVGELILPLVRCGVTPLTIRRVGPVPFLDRLAPAAEHQSRADPGGSESGELDPRGRAGPATHLL